MDIVNNWFAPAKLNLFFHVVGKRKCDHYHNIKTLFQLLDYGDTLTFHQRPDHQILLESNVKDLANDNNLIIIAARRLQHYLTAKKINSCRFGVTITLNKKLPIGAGLGGGSSNAATTLIALNHLWQLKLPLKKLMAIGRNIGADVPFFIKGQSAIATGIGDILTAVNTPQRWFLVITPPISISTAAIFGHPDLLLDQAADKNNSPPFYNDCEPLVRKLYPDLNQLMNQINHLAPIRLTGTGSAFFASFTDKKEAYKVQQQLPKQVSSFIAKGINQSPIRTFLDK